MDSDLQLAVSHSVVQTQSYQILKVHGLFATSKESVQIDHEAWNRFRLQFVRTRQDGRGNVSFRHTRSCLRQAGERSTELSFNPDVPSVLRLSNSSQRSF